MRYIVYSSREPRAIVSGDVGMLKVNNIQKGMLDGQGQTWLWLQRVNIGTIVVTSYLLEHYRRLDVGCPRKEGGQEERPQHHCPYSGWFSASCVCAHCTHGWAEVHVCEWRPKATSHVTPRCCSPPCSLDSFSVTWGFSIRLC